MHFDQVAHAPWFDIVTPFAFGAPTFDLVMVPTMTLVMIESTVMFLALSDIIGMIPLVAPRWRQQMAHELHPLLESGILPAILWAVLLNLYFDGARGETHDAVEAAKLLEAH